MNILEKFSVVCTLFFIRDSSVSVVFQMKKKIPDPLDNYYNYNALVYMYTELSELNSDVIDNAIQDVENYIEEMKQKSNIGAISAIGMLMRLATDSAFKKQMLEARLQHRAIIATLTYGDDTFFNDYLFPRIKELSMLDFKDTRDYRLSMLKDFTFQQFSEELASTLADFQITFDEELIQKATERIQEVNHFFETSRLGE